MKKCTSCGSENINIGHVIDPLKQEPEQERSLIAYRRAIDHSNMRVIYCIKCMSCGHSERWGDEKVKLKLDKP